VATGTPEEIALVATSYTGQYLRPILQAAGTLAVTGTEPAAVGAAHRAPARVEVDGIAITPRKRKAGGAAASGEPGGAAPSANGRSGGRANVAGVGPGAAGNEAKAAAAADRIDARITREATPEPQRPETKAAARRRRQAESPRKETASERDLRETREARDAARSE
jgi:excinuclease ABC subunit A